VRHVVGVARDFVHWLTITSRSLQAYHMPRVCKAASLGILVSRVGHPSAEMDFLFVENAVAAHIAAAKAIMQPNVSGLSVSFSVNNTDISSNLCVQVMRSTLVTTSR
jgi:hypothetical protein